MKIVIYGLTITSAWGNGHATTYRSLVKALSAAIPASATAGIPPSKATEARERLLVHRGKSAGISRGASSQSWFGRFSAARHPKRRRSTTQLKNPTGESWILARN